MIFDEFKSQLPDSDEAETQEWIESLDAVLETAGKTRAQFLLYKLLKRARMLHIGLHPTTQTRYINTISPEHEPDFPGDEELERRIRRLIRWNAVAMVHRANVRSSGLGGHLSTYASAASLYEVGFNHFFRGRDHPGGGDHVYIQGHCAPGMYARSYLLGQMTEQHLDHFRREVSGVGLSSYPHPRLMPDYWEFPTVSMGLGPICAIYHARFNRYLADRGLVDTSGQRIWCFVGDGETDEPETLGALSIAAREGLDNLVFVVNCNLQRLDGPVRGNGKIIQELEANFRGSGWNVVKVIWGREWDELLRNDVHGLLVQKMSDTLDGDYQRYVVDDGAEIRKNFFGPDPRLGELVSHLSDGELKRLRRGGHDYRKVYAAYDAATQFKGGPTVVLAKTVKGWTLGNQVEGRNVTHQIKKLSEDELRIFRDRLELPIPDKQLGEAPYYHPGMTSEEVEYMRERRIALGGLMPVRRFSKGKISVPSKDLYSEFMQGTDGQLEASTTKVFVRLLRKLLKDKAVGKRVVPIIPDEARTFGMEPLFREIKIYNPRGQQYKPVDAEFLLRYTEAKDGQILEEGITEAGSMASFIAAGTTHATQGEPMIPFFIFYSMFGFQRIADLIWLFGDARGRGFLLGATAGRTTLNGEGLQHQDGHGLLVASTVPSCLAYDPAYAYEIAVIVREGMRRMWKSGEDIFYYITLYNEDYPQPPMPKGAEDGIIRGIYPLRGGKAKSKAAVQILASGPLMREAQKAQTILSEKYSITADLWSATSYSELRRDALSCDRWNTLHPQRTPRIPYIRKTLGATSGPIIAVSDSMKSVPDQVSPWLDGRLYTLGTDGFGRSDTREALRRFFEIDAEHIVVAALSRLARAQQIDPAIAESAIADLGVDPEALEATADLRRAAPLVDTH